MPGRVGHFPQKNLHLLLSILRKSRNNMNATTINSSPLNDSPVISTSHDAVCKHHTRNGRCRLPVADPLATLCAEHVRRQRKQDKAASLSAELIAGLTEFKSAVPINDFLSRLLLFQAQDRIPPRRRHGLYLQPPPPHPPRHPAGKSRPATENHHRHA